MNRRVFLKAASGSSVAGLAFLAGCSSSGNAGNASGANGTAGGNESGGQTATGGAETAASTGTAGTNGSENATAGGSNGTSGSSGGSKTVGMHTEGGNYYFDPIGLFVETGTTVTFECESGSHSSTAYKKGTASAEVTRIPEGAEAWNSETIPEGESYDHTFETEGTYDYFCLPHKTLGMVGRIVVGSPGGPAEGSMPPDGTVPESDAIVEKGSIAYSDFR